ncbi:MAG: hypothetical protein D3922_13130, partial [Candidatus Electrothrix sp. AR1]|nr:hypothetical protein [Candidatus Electrothrix sp. AR1]
PATEQVALFMICCPELEIVVQDAVSSINCSRCLAKKRISMKKNTFLLFGNAPLPPLPDVR